MVDSVPPEGERGVRAKEPSHVARPPKTRPRRVAPAAFPETVDWARASE